MKPELSIIICCHNEEKYLPECLKSLKLNEHPAWEAIVIDDASTDKSREILRFFQKKFSNLYVHELDYNVGLGSARNMAMLLAKGAYINFLDADDYVDADALARKVEQIRSRGADILISAHQRLFDTGLALFPLESAEYSGPAAACMYLARAFNTWASWVAIYKREHLIACDCFFAPRMYYEDVKFCLPAYYRAAKAVTSEEPFYVYRCNNQSITRGKTNSLLHLMSSARLYFDMVTFVQSRPPLPMLQKSFRIALEILKNEHLPRMSGAMEQNLHKSSAETLAEFQHYMTCYDSDFARMALNAAAL